VYEESPLIALREIGLLLARQVSVPVWFRDHKAGDSRAEIREKPCKSVAEVSA
jgi:hypothetical protein